MTAVAWRAACSSRRPARCGVAQIHEQDFGQAEIGEPQRIADRRDDDENRKSLGTEHASEHEGLHEAHGKGAAGGRAAQQQVRDRDQPLARRVAPGAASSGSDPILACIAFDSAPGPPVKRGQWQGVCNAILMAWS